MRLDELRNVLSGLIDPAAWGIGAAVLLFLYFGAALATIARKTNVPDSGLAFVPVINLFYLCRVARRSMGWALVFLFPLTTLVAVIALFGGLAEVRGRSSAMKWLAVVPIVNLIALGYLAFRSDGVSAATSRGSSAALTLSVGGGSLRLAVGTKLAADQLSAAGVGLVGTIATVVAKAGQPVMLGLQNNSPIAWTAHMASGRLNHVPPGHSVRLEAGAEIEFAPVTGRIGAWSGTGAHYLQLGNRRVSLSSEDTLTSGQLGLAGDQPGNIGLVEPNPRQPAVLGLKNLSSSAWAVTLASGSKVSVESGHSLRLQDGAVVRFGFARGVVGGTSPARPDRPLAVDRSRFAWRRAVATAAPLLAIAGCVYWFGLRRSNSQLGSNLTSGDGAERLAAARALGDRRAADAVGSLLTRSDDEEKEVRDAAIESLAAIGAPAVSALIDAVLAHAQDFELAATADAALTKMGERAIPELERLLGDHDRGRRHAAAVALSRQKHRAYPALVRSLHSSEPRVQLAALEALPRIGPAAADATADLAGLLEHPNVMVRANAAFALAHFGLDGAAAIPALVDALADAAPQVRASAALALGEMAPAAQPAVALLRRLGSDPEAYVAAQAQHSLQLVLLCKGMPSTLPPHGKLP